MSSSENRSASRASALPRISLGVFPTPLEPLERLSKALGGPRLWIKRDDLSGLAMGGNKVRKLELLLADALASGADTILTAGAMQSNHCRQTAAAAAHLGLRCDLVLGGEEPTVPEGNLLLDLLFGAHVHWSPRERRGERLKEVEEKLRSEGRKPYVIPYGGSNEIGAAAFAGAMAELLAQLSSRGMTADAVVVASSSGGTQAGLMVGARAASFTGTVIGISIDKGEAGDEPYDRFLQRLSNDTAARMGLPMSFQPDDFCIRTDFQGEGYGIVGENERAAIRLLARTEGILLDPVYTGRAMGGLLSMIRNKEFSQGKTVVFWHTGGAPALFAYAADIFPSHSV